MITLPEVEKLGRIHAVEPVVLSLYLNVPRSAAQRPRLPDRVDELVAAERNAGRAGHLREEDRRSAREEAAGRSALTARNYVSTGQDAARRCLNHDAQISAYRRRPRRAGIWQAALGRHAARLVSRI